MDTSPRLQDKLTAAATLLGYDTAIAIINDMRRPLLDHLAKAQASEVTQEQILADFQAETARIVEGVRPQAQNVKRKYTKRSSSWGKKQTKPQTRFTLPSPRKLHKQAEKAESKVVVGMAKYLTHGPQPIRMILQHLSQKCLIEDTGAANVRAVTAILKTNATFARAQKGNWYKLRTGKTKA